MKDAPLSDLLIQARINTENQLMAFFDYSWQYCTHTVRSTGEYIIFYQCGTINHGTHVTVPVDQSRSGSEYNAACTAGIALAHFRMLIHECLNKDTHIVPAEAPLIILGIKSAMGVPNNGKDNKHTRHIARRVHFVMNGEKDQNAQYWLVRRRSAIARHCNQECWW